VSRSFMARCNEIRQRVRRMLTATELGVSMNSKKRAKLPERTVCRHDDENDERKRPIELDRKHDKGHSDIKERGDDLEQQKLPGDFSATIIG
jgi:hypothetical protein